MVKVYYYDNEEGDCRLPHESGDPLPETKLKDVGVLYYSFPIGAPGSEEDVAKLAKERNYKNKDVITVAPEAMGDVYESKIKTFFAEHMHEDEEIRYIVDGKGYFDVRNEGDRWIRILMEAGDLIVLPAGIYHRFTVDTDNYIKATRLFQDEPKWEALPRSEKTEANPHRHNYISARG